MKSIRFLALPAMLFVAEPAWAGFILTADIDAVTQTPTIGADLTNGDSATDGTTTVTFSNVQAVGGGAAAGVDEDGIAFGAAPTTVGTSVDLVFDANVVIDSFEIGFVDASFAPAGAGFQLAGPNGTSGLNVMDTVGTFAFDMGTIPVLLAGATYTLSHNIADNFAQLRGFTVTVQPTTPSVSAPATLVLLGAGLAGLRLLRRT